MNSLEREMLPSGEHPHDIFRKISESIDTIIRYPEHIDSLLKQPRLESDAKKTPVDEKIECNMSVIVILGLIFNFKDEKKLGNFRLFIESFLEEPAAETVDIPVSSIDFISFLKKFSEQMGGVYDPLSNFRRMLGEGTKYAPFQEISIKIFKTIFFRQNISKLSFYEFSLINNFYTRQFDGVDYVNRMLDSFSRFYVMEIEKSYVSNFSYVLSDRFIYTFAKTVRSMVNACNGLIAELKLSQEDVTRIYYILLIFSTDNGKSIFANEFGNTELFYCAARTINQNPEFAKELLKFMKAKLCWVFESERRGIAVQQVYQTIYKYEYKKIIGGLRKVNGFCRTSKRVVVSPANAVENKKYNLKVNVLRDTPTTDRKNTKQAFSPLSRRIGEARQSGKDEDFDSKRKLFFE
ncbi:hypothetical protein ENBRE01_1343 [Enteropsectra breve]|nr:hypothetical protein ENBRE01_1343 [Enteropsectra breve]